MDLRRPPVDPADARRLRDIISEKGVKRNGPYKLTKGGTSPYLFDLKPVMFDPEACALIGKIGTAFAHEAGATFAGGRELGAVPLAAVVAQHSFAHPPHVAGFFVRKQAKEHGLKQLVEGNIPGAGDKVLVLEDVTTTGGSALDTVVELRKSGAEVVGVLTIVDREEGAAANFTKEGLPFGAVFSLRDFPEVVALRSS